MSYQYDLLLPTSAEPQGGFIPSSQVDFLLNNPGRALKQNTLRLTGLLSITNAGSPLTLGDGVSLNPNAGAHSLLNHVMVMLDGRMVESIVEYGRISAAQTEATHSCIELGALSDQVIELKATSQDGSKTSLTAAAALGQITGDQQGKIPFSILLNCCLNKSTLPISFAKTGQVHLRFVLQQPTDVFYAPDIDVSDLTYTVSQMALRYQTQVDEFKSFPNTLERISYAGQQSILSTFNTFSTISPVGFESTILLFRDSTHVNTTQFDYDPVLNEFFTDGDGFSVIPNYVEYTLSGEDTPLTFPLRTGQEMWTNYIVAAGGSLRKNGVNLAKFNGLEAAHQNCGFGLGVHMGGEVASQPCQVTINFDSPLPSKYNCYIFYKGRMML